MDTFHLPFKTLPRQERMQNGQDSIHLQRLKEKDSKCEARKPNSIEPRVKTQMPKANQCFKKEELLSI